MSETLNLTKDLIENLLRVLSSYEWDEDDYATAKAFTEGPRYPLLEALAEAALESPRFNTRPAPATDGGALREAQIQGAFWAWMNNFKPGPRTEAWAMENAVRIVDEKRATLTTPTAAGEAADAGMHGTIIEAMAGPRCAVCGEIEMLHTKTERHPFTTQAALAAPPQAPDETLKSFEEWLNQWGHEPPDGAVCFSDEDCVCHYMPARAALALYRNRKGA